MQPYIDLQFAQVRVVHLGSPFDLDEDIQVQKLVDGQWKRYWGTNSLSNDFAFTQADEIAFRLSKELRQNEAD